MAEIKALDQQGLTYFYEKYIKDKVDMNFLETAVGVIQGEIDSKMDKQNPTGTGSFSLNRAANTDVGVNSFAAGESVRATGQGSHAEGQGAGATAAGAHAEGQGSQASGVASHAEGSGAQAQGQSSHAEGQGSQATQQSAHAEGQATKATGMYAHSEGDLTEASGQASHAEGSSTHAESNQSHAEGAGTYARGVTSHAEGNGTQAYGTAAHAEGIGNEARGDGSHVEGSSTLAYGKGSHAEGISTTAGLSTAALTDNVGSHAEGNGSKATGIYSHAEGDTTTASGRSSHAEGSGTTASGQDSHAEGGNTTASGVEAHSEGKQTQAKGNGSHAEGSGTIASGYYQHVQGKYNIEDTQDKYAHIVGGGENVDTRKNIHTIDWDGNATFSGKVTAGANPTNDMDLATKKYVDEVAASSSSGGSSAQTDWNETDSSNPAYLKNKPFGEVNFEISWDGTPTSAQAAANDLPWYLISDVTPDANSIKDVAIHVNVGSMNIPFNATPTDINGRLCFIANINNQEMYPVFIAYEGDYEDLTPGLYCVDLQVASMIFGSSIDSVDVEWVETKKINPIYLPELNGGTQPDWDEIDNDSPAFIKNKPFGQITFAADWDGSNMNIPSFYPGPEMNGFFQSSFYWIADTDTAAENIKNAIITLQTLMGPSSINLIPQYYPEFGMTELHDSRGSQQIALLFYEGNVFGQQPGLYAADLSSLNASLNEVSFIGFTISWQENKKLPYEYLPSIVKEEKVFWDGNTGGLIKGTWGFDYYKISDLTPEINQLTPCKIMMTVKQSGQTIIQTTPFSVNENNLLDYYNDGSTLIAFLPSGAFVPLGFIAGCPINAEDDTIDIKEPGIYCFDLSILAAFAGVEEIVDITIIFKRSIIDESLQLNDKKYLNRNNPFGSGSFSLNRRKNTEIGEYSFTEGYESEASGQYSHAEGNGTHSRGDSSHSEGGFTIADGNFSHAEGIDSCAKGNYSHAEGGFTVAQGEYQHVQGKYNVIDEEGKYAHIIGNGSSEQNRNNIHTVDWSGNAVYAGTVTAADPTEDNHLVTKRYVDSLDLGGGSGGEMPDLTGYLTQEDADNGLMCGGDPYVTAGYLKTEKVLTQGEIDSYGLTKSGDAYITQSETNALLLNYITEDAVNAGLYKNNSPYLTQDDANFGLTRAGEPYLTQLDANFGLNKDGIPYLTSEDINPNEVLTQENIQSIENDIEEVKSGFIGLASEFDGRFRAMEQSMGYTNQRVDEHQDQLNNFVNSVPFLDPESNQIPARYLPSYVDDVIDGIYDEKTGTFSDENKLPVSPEGGKIYVDTNTNKTYRWSGKQFVQISSGGVTLGETNSTAYPGDKGAAAYAHAVTNKGAAFTDGLYKIRTNSEGHVIAAKPVARVDILDLGIEMTDLEYAALEEMLK